MDRWQPTMLFVFLAGQAIGQPYLDVVGSAFTYSPERLQRWEVGLSLPIPIGKANDKIILSPFWEEWKILVPAVEQPHFAERSDRSTGWALPVSWLHEVKGGRWKLLFTGIIRHNHLGPLERGAPQYGGAFITTYGPKPKITWKVGFYANGDAFGLFWLPLLGLDWRIDGKHNVWGLLPGTMHYEHKAFKRVHWGAAFKAFTNSYGLRNGDFRRVDENQIGVFGDLYFFERNVVLRLEVGHTVFSQYQGGELDERYAALAEGQYVDHHIGDGPYVKMLLAFRVRLDAEQKQRNDLGSP
ncbi:MAG: hypothetical protein ABI599_13725 [Flavobacteriales bacterium]